MVSPRNNAPQSSATNAADTQSKATKSNHGPSRRRATPEFVFPEGNLSRTELIQQLEGEDTAARNQALAALLSYAPWAQIWDVVTPEEVRAALPELDLPSALATAWQKTLESDRTES